MSRFAEVTHLEWIAAPIDRVRAQFADLKHHIHDNVHPKLSFKEIGNVGGAYRFEQCVKLLGIRQRDIFERSFAADGTMTDRSIEGFNKGGSVQIAFRPDSRADGGARRDGTEVSITVKLPLPPLIGGLIRPLLCKQIRKEVVAAAAEDRHDIEVRGYRPQRLAA